MPISVARTVAGAICSSVKIGDKRRLKRGNCSHGGEARRASRVFKRSDVDGRGKAQRAHQKLGSTLRDKTERNAV